jgi:hypothetical protein
MRRLTLSVLAVSLSAVPLATADSGGSVWHPLLRQHDRLRGPWIRELDA